MNTNPINESLINISDNIKELTKAVKNINRSTGQNPKWNYIDNNGQHWVRNYTEEIIKK